MNQFFKKLDPDENRAARLRAAAEQSAASASKQAAKIYKAQLRALLTEQSWNEALKDEFSKAYYLQLSVFLEKEWEEFGDKEKHHSLMLVRHCLNGRISEHLPALFGMGFSRVLSLSSEAACQLRVEKQHPLLGPALEVAVTRIGVATDILVQLLKQSNTWRHL
eukprot:gene27361-4663_t